MKQIFFALLMSLSNFCLHAESISSPPKETLVLQLPDHSEKNWKEISRQVNKEIGLIELIPLNQTTKNWSELICIQYFSSEDWDQSKCTIEYFLERLRKETLARYPKNTATWKIIEKDNNGVTFEWQLLKPYKDKPIQHEVVRAFFTSSGFHRVGFTRRYQHMNSDESANWVKLLRENSSVVPFRDGVAMTGLSMVEKLQHSISLGTHFHDWKVMNHTTGEHGHAVVTYIPPILTRPYIDERLDIISTPNTCANCEELFAIEKNYILKNYANNSTLCVLEKSPTEIIYSFCSVKDIVHENIITRTLLTDRACYSIRYRKKLVHQMKKEDTIAILEKIKTIDVQGSLKPIPEKIDTVAIDSQIFESIMEKSTPDGAQLSVHRMNDARMFHIRGSSFKPNEEITIVFANQSEGHYKASSTGDVFIFAMAGKIDETGGIEKVTILRDSGILSIEYPWGTAAKKEQMPSNQVVEIKDVNNASDAL